MNTHANKTPENKNRSLADQAFQKQPGSESAFGFKGNNPQANQLKAIRETADNSPRAQQVAQMQAMADQHAVQKKENNTGLPDNLKSGVENISGYSLDDVKVYYNSPKPAQLQAHAYAQGTDIHVASGQEKHLPHEAWHVVQQKQGRVKPTVQMKGNVNVNDDSGLENEADVMGAKALQLKAATVPLKTTGLNSSSEPLQMALYKSAEVKMIESWNPNSDPWPGTKGDVGIWKDTGAVKGSEVTDGGSNLCRAVEKVTDDLSTKQQMGSPHMAPKRMGGKGNIDNVRPWKSTFETTHWHGALDGLVMTEFVDNIAKDELFYEHVEADEGHKKTNVWLKPLQDKHDASEDNADKTKLATYLAHLRNILQWVPDSATIKTPKKDFPAGGTTFDPAAIDMAKAKTALATFNTGNLDNVKPAAPVDATTLPGS